MIESALHVLLLADAAVYALTDVRIYHLQKKSGVTAESVVLTLQSADRPHNMQGASGYVQGVISLACYGPTYQATKTLADTVRLAVDGYSGTSNGVAIDFLLLENESAIYFAPHDGKNSMEISGIEIDVKFQYRESIPTF